MKFKEWNKQLCSFLYPFQNVTMKGKQEVNLINCASKWLICPHFSLGRLGEAVDRTLLNHLLKMFIALGIYSESFEKPFLECTSEFYAAEGVKYMQYSDVPDYLKHVEVCIILLFPL